MKDRKKGKLGRKISGLIVLCMAVMTALLAVFSYRSMRSSYISFYAQRAQSTSRMLAELVDGDRVGEWLKTGETDEYYEQLEEIFCRMKEVSGVAFTYIFYPMEDHFIYVLDGYTAADDKSSIARLGDIYNYGETEYRYLYPDVRAGRASGEIILGKDVGYGESVSAWAPVFDKNGKLAAMVEADFYLDEVNGKIAAFLVRFLAILFSCIAGVVLLLLVFVRRLVSGPVEMLARVISSYRDGSFERPDRDIKTGDEIQLLYEAFVELEERLSQYVKDIARIAGEKERIGAELSIATQIQADMLPSIFPAFPDRGDVDIYASMRPAKEVGGDFYDFFLVEENVLAVVIADVSGKGVPAALFMVIAKTLIKNHACLKERPAEIFENVNRQLCEGNREGFFVTAWLSLINLETGEVSYVNAGHNPPALIKKDGRCVWLNELSGFVLAGLEEMVYSQGSFVLGDGDRLFLYTDGVTEAMNRDGALFGEDRLQRILMDSCSVSVRECVGAVEKALSEYSSGVEQSDDITMLSVERQK